MADNPITVDLPADLPENWTEGQTIAPTGTAAALTKQHGYNYLMEQVNNAQTAASEIGDAFSGLANAEDVPLPSSEEPLMDGEASAGTSANYARADHRHPTDTSRAASSHNHSASNITSGTLPIARGGTGATTAAAALSALTCPAGSILIGNTRATAGTATIDMFAAPTSDVGDFDARIEAKTNGDLLIRAGNGSYGCVSLLGYNVRLAGENNYTQDPMAHYAIAGGNNCTAAGDYAVAFGRQCNAQETYSVAMGRNCEATALYAVAIGYTAQAESNCAVALGRGTSSNYAALAAGKHNRTMTGGGSDASKTGDAMVVGNGSGTISGESNAFRVDYQGNCYGLSAWHSSGADYAEFFEWADGNSNAEDRVGYAVTLDGNKIRIANDGEYILGFISGNPSIIGNGDEDWLGRWVRDEFGRIRTKSVTDTDENGNETSGIDFVQTDGYDPTKKYIQRRDRREWDPVALVGAVPVRDDGTCSVNGYCSVTDGGIVTAAERGADTYRVIERVSDFVVRIIMR